MIKKNARQVEFGDFQTPDDLAERVAQAVALRGGNPRTIVEPTCGRGSFLMAAMRQFPRARTVIGLEIDGLHFETARRRVEQINSQRRVDLRHVDFFECDWQKVFESAEQPILVIGNPPWVTASELGLLESRNLPAKSNFQGRRGFDAITGKSNFDIAEWMSIHLLQRLSGKRATLAMLLKTSVARKVLFHVWREGLPLADAAMYKFDAKKEFGVAAEACLLACDLSHGPVITQCRVYGLDAPEKLCSTVAFYRGMMLADVEAFQRHENLLGDSRNEPFYRWRSGVKHDCSRVMELRLAGEMFRNGYGETVELEPDFVYPMLKGSAVANGGTHDAETYMLVTQRETGQETDRIKRIAPSTWNYLLKHADAMDGRGSSIYRNRPRFSVFGVGPYTFSPWKVAICGLYKRLEFSVVAPREGRPVVLDDTAYFLSCESQEEAHFLAELLRSEPAKEFLGSFVFWDSKRPITAEILGRLDIEALAVQLGQRDNLLTLRGRPNSEAQVIEIAQGRLF